MEDNEDVELSPLFQKLLIITFRFMAFFYWMNLFVFLVLFFGITFPNIGKSNVGHYFIFALILIIMACVSENLKRRKSFRLFLGFTTLLFAVNTFVVWRNWFFQ